MRAHVATCMGYLSICMGYLSIFCTGPVSPDSCYNGCYTSCSSESFWMCFVRSIKKPVPQHPSMARPRRPCKADGGQGVPAAPMRASRMLKWGMRAVAPASAEVCGCLPGERLPQPALAQPCD